jgi:hypothetical protein
VYNTLEYIFARLLLAGRDGRVLQADLSEAISRSGLTTPLYVGRAVEIHGKVDSNGVLEGQVVRRAKSNPKIWWHRLRAIGFRARRRLRPDTTAEVAVDTPPGCGYRRGHSGRDAVSRATMNLFNSNGEL